MRNSPEKLFWFDVLTLAIEDCIKEMNGKRWRGYDNQLNAIRYLYHDEFDLNKNLIRYSLPSARAICDVLDIDIGWLRDSIKNNINRKKIDKRSEALNMIRDGYKQKEIVRTLRISDKDVRKIKTQFYKGIHRRKDI